jgi:hypothetical protein
MNIANLTRYEPEYQGDSYQPKVGMGIDKNGRWVKLEDVKEASSNSNARDKIYRPCGCIVCKHNAMHECQLPECKFSKRKTAPVA